MLVNQHLVVPDFLINGSYIALSKTVIFGCEFVLTGTILVRQKGCISHLYMWYFLKESSMHHVLCRWISYCSALSSVKCIMARPLVRAEVQLLSYFMVDSLMTAKAVTHLWATFLLTSELQSPEGKGGMVCDAGRRCCSINHQQARGLVTVPGQGWNAPRG